jgi:hypothetical protein
MSKPKKRTSEYPTKEKTDTQHHTEVIETSNKGTWMGRVHMGDTKIDVEVGSISALMNRCSEVKT